ncbi:MAG TPA: 5-oxoprolinase subunit PxpB [Gemmatimonadaceae bacterium]
MIRPLGESAFLIELGEGGPARAGALAAQLRDAPPAGVLDAVAAYDTVAVYFDPLACSPEELGALLLRELQGVSAPRQGRAVEHVIRVTYDGEDLDLVADRTGLSRADVIGIHAAGQYSVLAIGFVPGFAYLGELDDRLSIPRRETPRTRVPAGSVAIAGRQTAVYPFTTPGGWHIIGRTDARMFDPTRSRPSLLAVGDSVRFVPT